MQNRTRGDQVPGRIFWKRICALALGGAGLASVAVAQDRFRSVVSVPSYRLPFSNLASREAAALFDRQRVDSGPAPGSTVDSQRRYYDAINRDRVRRIEAIYPSKVTRERLGGVQVDRVDPLGGIASANRGRILLNLHGGAFLWGAGSGGLVEAVPIAGEGRITVLSVDYRQGPEFRFPAGSEDVVAVYRALLKRYAARAIGIYGCSAGGVLTAQSVALIHAKRLPMPGAIGTFCGSVTDMGGDSAYFAPASYGQKPPAALTTLLDLPYFSGVRPNDPLAFPGTSRAALAAFPPTLLITGTRDFAMSSVIHSNELLVETGVQTELHVWEGMGHAFFSDPEPPESRQAYRVIARFFLRHLAPGLSNSNRKDKHHAR